MTLKDVSKLRLANQQVSEQQFSIPKELVDWLGAVQAQDYGMSKWALGIRLPKATDEVIEDALNNGDIIRTHVLRPTWHIVSRDDVRWMLKLTAPRIITTASTMFRKLELDEKVFKKTYKILERLLAGGQQLTRQELMTELKKAKIDTDELRASHIMLRAELDGVVCNGARRGKQFTYALLDERVPLLKDFTKDEASAMLANKYFASHGPATIKDFIWWSGLSVTDAKAGLEAIKPGFISEKIGTETYWFVDTTSNKKYRAGLYFLPAFDEFIISYKDRSPSLDPVYFYDTFTVNGIFKPLIVVNGKVTGTWKRTIVKDKILMESQFFNSQVALSKQEVVSTACLKKYGKFLGSKIEILDY